MKIIHTADECKRLMKLCRLKQQRVGFVPTMGALHQGHISLIRRAREENDIVCVSVFVNPAQFGPNEDYLSYPRTLDADAALCRDIADYLLCPEASEMYPEHDFTRIQVNTISDPLCGARRPGHFAGVATVVMKLLNIVKPDNAYFGLKDYQQFLVIQRMCRDLFCDTVIHGCPIVRESNGLAMSSRNQYLTDEERKNAAVIYQSLCKSRDLIAEGCRDYDRIQKSMMNEISESGGRIDYFEILDADTLQTPVHSKHIVIAAAVFFGRARLIDNILVTIHS